MYHHFPDGKEQIAIEAVASMRNDIIGMLHKLESEERSVAEIIRWLAKGMAQWLKESEWREGTMLVSTTVGSVPDLPKLHAAIKEAFDEWRQHVAKLLMREGWTKAAALSMAQTLIAATEGAMILARIDQDDKIVLKIAETMASLVESRK
jgi:hypothetical protein